MDELYLCATRIKDRNDDVLIECDVLFKEIVDSLDGARINILRSQPFTIDFQINKKEFKKIKIKKDQIREGKWYEAVFDSSGILGKRFYDLQCKQFESVNVKFIKKINNSLMTSKLYRCFTLSNEPKSRN